MTYHTSIFTHSAEAIVPTGISVPEILSSFHSRPFICGK
jgi:hypothetical protein